MKKNGTKSAPPPDPGPPPSSNHVRLLQNPSMYELQFGVQRNIRYHMSRRKWYSFWANAVNATILMAGSSAVYPVVEETGQEYVLIMLITVAVLTTLNILFKFSTRAAIHYQLQRDFSNLDAEMTLCDDQSVEAPKPFRAKRLKIEQREPPALWILGFLKHNELCRAIGKDNFYKVNIFQRLLSQVIDIRPDLVKPVN